MEKGIKVLEHRREGRHSDRKEGERKGSVGLSEKGKRRHLYLVPRFESRIVRVGVLSITCMMWCTNDVSFIFVVEWVSWIMGEGILKSRRESRQERGGTRLGQKIEVSITPSSGMPHSLELCHTSRQFGGLHRGLGQSGVEWERLPGCGPKDLDDEKPY